jgi:hypothetical protein
VPPQENVIRKSFKKGIFVIFHKASWNVLFIRAAHFWIQRDFFYRKLVETMTRGSIWYCFKSMPCLNQRSQRCKRLWYQLAWSAASNLQLLVWVQLIIAEAIWGLEMGQSSRVFKLLLLPQFWSHSLAASTNRQLVSWCNWCRRSKNLFLGFEDFW